MYKKELEIGTINLSFSKRREYKGVSDEFLLEYINACSKKMGLHKTQFVKNLIAEEILKNGKTGLANTTLQPARTHKKAELSLVEKSTEPQEE